MAVSRRRDGDRNRLAVYFGLLGRIWYDDSSQLSSVVAALVVGTTAYFGWLSWRIPEMVAREAGRVEVLEIEEAVDWGTAAADLCPAIGLAGTIYGPAQQAAALKEGGDVPVSWTARGTEAADRTAPEKSPVAHGRVSLTIKYVGRWSRRLRDGKRTRVVNRN